MAVTQILKDFKHPDGVLKFVRTVVKTGEDMGVKVYKIFHQTPIAFEKVTRKGDMIPGTVRSFTHREERQRLPVPV